MKYLGFVLLFITPITNAESQFSKNTKLCDSMSRKIIVKNLKKEELNLFRELLFDQCLTFVINRDIN